MKINNICCIGGDLMGRIMCFSVAYKCPEVRVNILVDKESIAEWNSNTLSFCDPELAQLIKKCRHRNLFFSTNYESCIKEADVIFLSVKIPMKPFPGRKEIVMDFKELEEATKPIALYSESDKILVDHSDVPVKAVEIISRILSNPSRPFIFQVLSVPCYLSDKFSLEDTLNPKRIGIGCENSPSGRAAAQALCELYEYWVPQKNIIILSYYSAELYKLLTNSFIVQKEVSVNSLSTICEEFGGDISNTLKGLGESFKLNNIKPSLGIEKFYEDVSNLILKCQILNLTELADYWQSVLELNEFFVKRFIEKINNIMPSMENVDITVWGFPHETTKLSRKKSPALKICKWLLSKNCNLRIYDPGVPKETIFEELDLEKVKESERNLKFYQDLYVSIKNSSAIIICSRRKEFVEVDFNKLERWMKRPLIIDGHKFYDEENLKKIGIEYYTIGLYKNKNQTESELDSLI